MLNWFRQSPPPNSQPPSADPQPQQSAPDYEQVLQDLLAEVAQGKTWGNLQGFFIFKSVKPEQLASWLQQQRSQWEAQPEQYRELGLKLVQLGQVARGELAIVATEIGQQLQGEAVEQQTLSEQAFSNDAIVWFGDGYQKFDSGDFEGAIASYDKALEIRPDFHMAWDNRGVGLSNLGRYEEAITSYDKAVEVKSNYHVAWNNRGIALHNLGRYDEAIASYDKALEIKPDDHCLSSH